MQARYYDPVIGRFYSNDPVGYIAENPVMSFNRYMYVNNNPYKYTDPDGELLLQAFGVIVGAYTAGKAAADAGGSDGEVALAAGLGAITGFFTGGLSAAAVQKTAAIGVTKALAANKAKSGAATLIATSTTGTVTAGASSAIGQLASDGKIDGGRVAVDSAKGFIVGTAAGAPSAAVGITTQTTELLGTMAAGGAATLLTDEEKK